ncbi:hypothetical protein CAL18_15405 [Bordetella genomosp. 7]|jgi:hypothetical protein|uniref:Uncharacterized protein n=1 Tax=Bordetella genomosp. 7 TaxID=1416805 RepID=A0A261QWR0_9BORD|nr:MULTISPECIES: hypothetical protein [Bordetella]OZI17238.1 hypothetical protein CAL19_15515 [Bordetella genomosp. 7]OZI17507.1 hypothetical protein CAL18_15405 [Bordetella genomosp. 7]
MTDTISRFFRAVAFAVLALFGMAMALVFMVSTAIAIGILYVVAKVRGKPFGVRAYWSQRQTARPGSFRPGAQGPFPAAPRDVIDVEVREVR